MDLSWNRKPKMCGAGHRYNVSYKTRQCITHQFMQILIHALLLITNQTYEDTISQCCNNDRLTAFDPGQPG